MSAAKRRRKRLTMTAVDRPPLRSACRPIVSLMALPALTPFVGSPSQAPRATPAGVGRDRKHKVSHQIAVVGYAAARGAGQRRELPPFIADRCHRPVSRQCRGRHDGV